MKATVDRSYEVETRKGGLLIRKALYGKLEGEQVRYALMSGPIYCVLISGRCFCCYLFNNVLGNLV